MKTKLLIIMSVLVLIPIQLVYAPPPDTDPEEHFRYSAHVITGKIISSEIIKDPRGDNSAETFYDIIIYQVKVEEWHKNPLENDIITVYGTHYPNDVIPEPDWGVVEFEIGDTVYLYINETDDGLEFRKYASKLLQKYIAEESKGYPPPLKQIKSGVSIDEIQCKQNLTLVIKQNGSPACVKPETKTKLIERGWAVSEVEPETELRTQLGGLTLSGTDEPVPEPKPEPQPETMSEGIPSKKFAPTEESFDGVFGIPITESEFNDVINYEPVKLHDLSEIIFNGQKLVLFEIRINPNTDIHYLYAPQTMKLNELKNKQDFFDSGGVLVKTVYLTNPTGVYQRLANDPSFEIEYLGTVPIRYHLYEEFNSLLLYPENERLVYIQTIADINKIKQLASSTKLKNDSLNLDDYVMTDWKLEEPKP